MPMAISFVGAAVIFKLIYDARPEDVAQIGVMNASGCNFDGGIWSFICSSRRFPPIALDSVSRR
jgi:alpha-glucoside transport system permease protein